MLLMRSAARPSAVVYDRIGKSSPSRHKGTAAVAMRMANHRIQALISYSLPTKPGISLTDDLLYHAQLNPRPVRAAEIYAFERLMEIVRWRLGNLHELLRIAVRQRKPGTLHLHHDSMSLPPGMRDVRQIERNPIRFVGIERYGLLEALAELTTERLAAD